MLVLGTPFRTGGLVAIFVAARVARATLVTADRVAFFRGLGRAYGMAGGAAPGAVSQPGIVLLCPSGKGAGPWTLARTTEQA